MMILGYAILMVYIIALSYICLFCLMQFELLFYYRKKHKAVKIPASQLDENDLPFVTIQLPIFNELYVTERLIDNIVKMDYPKDRYEIQVLDDSIDETVEIAKSKVEEYKKKGFNIEHVTREIRTGYKAGALKEATKFAKGTFIAIFDADFLPNPNFLRKTIPYFEDEQIGVVQTKWEHLNQNYSILTKLQAFQLNVHFTVEQTGRQEGRYFLQFNGTAGIWRKATIESAGGWEADTLTEDLDLSYRAQLKGWKIEYLENMGSPAELPAEMNGLKSQQFRWMKGGAETARKMLPFVWKSALPLRTKIHSTIHLLSSSIFLFVFVVGVFSVPVLYLLKPLNVDASYFAIFLTGLMSIAIVYFVANSTAAHSTDSFGKRLFKFIILFPVFLSLSMGLSLHNSIAVIQGYLGKKSAFIRTPKFDIMGIKDSFKSRDYLAKKVPLTTLLEGLLACYFLFAIFMGIYTKDTSFILFHSLLAFGYGSICFYSIRHLARS